jgi:DNA polymerase/3'-5' exonuclease PolX
MKNMLVAKILQEIANVLKMQAVRFKPRACRKAARQGESMLRPYRRKKRTARLKIAREQKPDFWIDPALR